MIFKTNYSKIKLLNAGVAKLADALDLGSSGKTVQVQVLSPAPVAAGSLTAASPVAIAGLQENLGGAFAAAAESTALHGTASMTGGIAAVISSVVISMLIVAGVTAGAL